MQLEIAEFLQKGDKHRLLQAYRGVGKSWITATYVVWRLWRNPQLEILVVSATGGKAEQFVSFCKQLITIIPYVQHLKPLPSDETLKWSQYQFDVRGKRPSQTNSLTAKGIYSQITGDRADVIIGDDVEVPDNTLTVEARDKLQQKTTEFENIIKPDSDEIILLGTPQSEESLYENFKNTGYHTCIWTALYPALGELDRYPHLANTLKEKVEKGVAIEGTSTDTRFTTEYLLGKRLKIGAKNFALQYMLDTTLSDVEKYPLKLHNLIMFDTDMDNAPVRISWSNDPQRRNHDLQGVGFRGDYFFNPASISNEWLPYEDIILAVDIAGKNKVGSDETAIVVLAFLNGKLFLLDWEGFVDGYGEDTLVSISKMAQKYKVNTIIIEDNYGDGMFTQLFKPILYRYHSCHVESIKNYTNKEKRMLNKIEPLVNQHKLVVNSTRAYNEIQEMYVEKKKSWEYSLLYQLTRVTYEKGSLSHDDRIDSLAVGVEYFTKMMDRDEDTIDDTLNQIAIEEMYRSYMGDRLYEERMLDTQLSAYELYDKYN